MTTRTTVGGGRRRTWARALALFAATIAMLVVVVPSASAGRRGVSGTMSIAGGASYATSPTVTLTLSVSGAQQMRFQNAGGSWSAWNPCTPTASWTLSAGDGAKTVNGQFRSSTGKTLSLNAGVVLDTTAPVTTAATSTPFPPFVDVALTPVDAVSGVADTMYRVDGSVWQSGTETSLCASRKRHSLKAGPHTVEFYSLDVAGNVETVQSLIVTL